MERGKHRLLRGYSHFFLCPSLLPHPPVLLLHGVQVLLLPSPASPVHLLSWHQWRDGTPYFPDFLNNCSRRMLRLGVEMLFWQKTVLAQWRAMFGNSCHSTVDDQAVTIPESNTSVPFSGFTVCTWYAGIVSAHSVLPLAASVLHTGLGRCILSYLILSVY